MKKLHCPSCHKKEVEVGYCFNCHFQTKGYEVDLSAYQEKSKKHYETDLDKMLQELKSLDANTHEGSSASSRSSSKSSSTSDYVEEPFQISIVWIAVGMLVVVLFLIIWSFSGSPPPPDPSILLEGQL
jgi:hypothetical protein